MSGQMADIVVVDDEEFALVEPDPGVLFEPRDHGLSPVMTHTANMRGELARYRIDGDGRLLLSDLQVGHVDEPPTVHGVTPSTDEHGQVWTYLGLDIPIEWSGDLILGADPIQDLYSHSGFSPVWHYERVLALDIEAGVVEAREDRSEQVAEFRHARSTARSAESEAGGDGGPTGDSGDGEDGTVGYAGDGSPARGSGGGSDDEDDDNAFERLLKSIRLRLPGGEDQSA